MTNLWTNVEELGEYADSDYAYDAVKTASYILWALSGRKFSGITTVTERYVCQYDPYLRVGGSSFNYWPTLVNGSVYNVPAGGYDRAGRHDYMADGTSVHSRLRLRGRKVIKVHAVRTIEGEIIPPNQYYISDHSVLQAVPNSSWRPCSVEVSYTYGSPPPSAGRAAARLLATELIKMYEGDETCALPQRVTTVARQGVSYTILDSQDFIDELRTGLYAVDLFLKASNPDRARARARVYSVDIPRARRTVAEPPMMPTSALDLVINEEGGATVMYLDEVGGDFILDDSAWTVSAFLSNYENTSNTEIESAAQIDRVNGTITVAISYNDALRILGARNPGVLSLYVTRPSLSNPEIDEVISLMESNAIIRLGERTQQITII
jgi:hypothetical protein